jgi:hypothetical protein
VLQNGSWDLGDPGDSLSLVRREMKGYFLLYLFSGKSPVQTATQIDHFFKIITN